VEGFQLSPVRDADNGDLRQFANDHLHHPILALLIKG
jgi:hypothetical protein